MAGAWWSGGARCATTGAGSGKCLVLTDRHALANAAAACLNAHPAESAESRAIVVGCAENGVQKPGCQSNQVSKEKMNSFDGNKKSGIEFKALLKTKRKQRSKQKGNRKVDRIARNDV